MELKWTRRALADITRLYEFLAQLDREAAVRVIQSLSTAPTRLGAAPRLGERLDEFDPREVRRILVGNYEMRYEIKESTIYVLRLWHTRENR